MSEISPAPAIFTPDDLKKIVEVDLAKRGVRVVAEVGEWSPEAKRGEPRVVIGLGRFSFPEPGGHHQPGPVVALTGGDVARPLLDDEQTFTIWVHSPPIGRAEDAASSARRATMALKRFVAAAIKRELAGPFRSIPSGDWPNPATLGPRYEGYVYGSIARFEVVLATPIPDDPLAVASAAELTSTNQAAYPDGTTTPTEDYAA